MSQVEKSVLRGLLIPDNRLTFWESESGEYESDGTTKVSYLVSGGPQAGIASPSTSTATSMTLSTSGTQDVLSSVDIVTQEGGFPNDAATFTWSSQADGFSDSLGWDPPNVITGWEPIVWSSTTYHRHPDAVTTPAGDVVVCVEVGSLSALTVKALQRDVDSGSWTTTSIYAHDVMTQYSYPCLCQLPSGRILCFFWRNDEDNDIANIRMAWSDDAGASWQDGASRVLPEDIPTSTSTGAGSSDYSLGRLRAAYAGGQILLLVGLLSMDTTTASHGGREALWQFASTDGGHTFREVSRLESTDTGVVGASFQDIVVLDDAFIVAAIESNEVAPRVRILGSADTDLTTTATILAAEATPKWSELDGTSKYKSDGDLCLFRDEAGHLYLTGRNTGLDHRWIVYHSSDGGDTWEQLERFYGTNPSKWWEGESSTVFPLDAKAVWLRGRALIVHRHEENPADYVESIQATYLGGYTSLCMPPTGAAVALNRRASWEYTYLPFDEPDATVWTRSSTGSPTTTLASGVLVVSAGNTEGRFYSIAPSGGISNGIMAEICLSVVTGTASFAVRLGSVSEGYSVTINVTGDQVSVYDVVGGGTQIDSTVDYDSDYVIVRVGMLDDNVAVYIAPYDGSDGERKWTLAAKDGGLTDDAGGTFTANRVRFGVDSLVAGSKSIAVRWVTYVTDEGGSTNYVGDNIYDATNPASLLGRNYASSPTYVTDGVSIAAQGGPTYAGDTWSIATRYQYPISNLLPSSAPSPRQVWRSSAVESDLTAAIHLAWRIDTSGGSGGVLDTDNYPGNDLLGLYLDGVNCAQIAVDLGYSSGWHEVAVLPVHTFSGTRAGNTVVSASSATGNTYRLDELKDSGIVFSSSSYTVVDWTGKIARNSEGSTISSGGTTKQAVLHLEQASGGSATSPEVTVWPRRFMLVIHPSGFSQTIQAIRLRIPVSTGTDYPGNPSDGYFEIGKMAFGPIVVFGHDYSWQRALTVESGTDVAETRDGRRISRVRAPSRTTLEINWADGVDLSDWRQQDFPDYIKGSANSGALPVAFRHDLPVKLMDLLRSLDGPDTPVVYIPAIAYDSSATSSGDTETFSENRAGGALYGRLTGPVRIEQVVGDEESSDLYRVTTVTVEEET